MLRRLQSVVSAAIYIYAGCMILRTRPQGASLAVWSNNPNNRPQAGYSLTADLLGVGLGPPFSADVHDRSADRGITLSYNLLVIINRAWHDQDREGQRPEVACIDA